MTAPQCLDPASDIVNVFIAAMREAFDPDPDAPCPPDGGGSSTVRFFAGDESALDVWDGGCKGPFLWVRTSRRFRSRRREFPSAFVGDWDCKAADVIPVMDVEVGVARCASADPGAKWSVLEDENVFSLDDAWRIETVLKAAVCRLRTNVRAVATDTVGVTGPGGGVISWTGMAYVQIV